MQLNEYQKISLRRGSFRKKGMLYVLASFFSIASIHHNEEEKCYAIRSSEIASLTERELNVFEKLIRHFSVYDKVDNGFLIFKYSWL